MTPMKIIISGTPGTGKTEVSGLLTKRLDYKLVDINTFAKSNNLITGTDTKRDTMIIDEKKLRQKSRDIKDNTIIEGHLAHYCHSDITIILRTDPKILKERLKKRQWSKEKIKENLESEALDIILQESINLNNDTYEIDTTKNTAKETTDIIIEMIENKKSKEKHRPGKIDWSAYHNNLFKTN